MAVTVIQDAREAVERALAATPSPEAMPEARLLPREQRLVWERLQRQDRQALRVSERLRAALKAGYDPVQVPQFHELKLNPETWEVSRTWSSGMVEHRHHWWEHARPDSLAAGTGVVTGIAALVGSIVASVIMNEPSVVFLGALAIPLVGGGIITAASLDSRGARPKHRNCTVFAQPIPAAALAKYQRANASGLFDDILVFSPDASAFRVENAPSRTTDPLMLGRIGEHHFLIAFWNLGEDVAFCESLKAKLGQA